MTARTARERVRLLKDRVFALTMAAGGVAVLVSILLIFFYLLYVVLPLFEGASIGEVERSLDAGPAIHVAIDEYRETTFTVAADGSYTLVRNGDGAVTDSGRLDGGAGGDISAIGHGDPTTGVVLAATGDGRVFARRLEHRIDFPDDVRRVTAALTWPLGDAALTVDPKGRALRIVAGQVGEEQATLVGVTDDDTLRLLHVAIETSFLDDEVTLEETRSRIPLSGVRPTRIIVDIDQRDLFVATDHGELLLFDITDKANVALVDRVAATPPEVALTALEFLSGGISVLVGDAGGGIAQWFPVRDENNDYSLARVRTFRPLEAGITRIAPEYHRKAFAAIDSDGTLALYHTTANRRNALRRGVAHNPAALSMAPRADAVVVQDGGGRIDILPVDNEHPEVSFDALWGKVWYESRAEPEFIWQSSSASSDFEPKYSLTPLTFGTLKATFYSMLFAMPLAVLGAIYTAYFMTPAMRAVVKPSIEVMAALPTVILGFLAGLWLAPLVEQELVGFFLSVAVVPLAVILGALAWSRTPQSWRQLIPDGWEALLLVPVIILAGWFSLELGTLLELLLFDGSAPHWLNEHYGITYDQRNSLVVGIAIGFAVIPTIFSISEDAVFSVPRSLTMGSLALGATPWQTAIRIVLLTASPGIFSAVMIGMGRAVGETMIVLMATGNTPIMDLNIFQGFRALSANIAVEMPESEVGSTHYRILFLAALVLFMFTFLVNTAAELVRQRLRTKYASL